MVKAQTGEWILNRRAVSSLESQGMNFDMANRGGIPAGGGEGGGGTVIHYAPVINAIDARGVEAVLRKHKKVVVGIMNRELGRYGKAPLGPAYG